MEKKFDNSINLILINSYLIGWGYLWVISLYIVSLEYFIFDIKDYNPFI